MGRKQNEKENGGYYIGRYEVSYAWNTAIVYIQECGKANYANQDWESINSNLTNTGTGQDEVCKINDMVSNIRELTTEYSSNTEPW